MAARCSSTRWASCRCGRRRACSAFLRKEDSNGSAGTVLIGTTEFILPEDLPESVTEGQSAGGTAAHGFHNEMNALKRSLIERALHEARGNRPEAPRILDITVRYLNRLSRNLGI